MSEYDNMRQNKFIVSKIWPGMIDIRCCTCGRAVAGLKNNEIDKVGEDVWVTKKIVSCNQCNISIPVGMVIGTHADLNLNGIAPGAIDGKGGMAYFFYGARGRSIKVYENKCVIKTEVTVGSLLTHNATDGEKTIYYSDVIGIQHKEPGLTLGYLQLETAAGTGNNNGSNFFNENTFTYDSTQVSEEDMRKVIAYIQERVEACKNAKNAPVVAAAPISVADEIKKFKELLDMGAITQEEFDAKKKQLLGL